MMHFKKLSAFLFICFTIHGSNIIFDLGGVLIDTSKYEAMGHIGFIDLIRHFKSPRQLFFSYYDSIFPPKNMAYKPLDDQGYVLPQLMCDWLSGDQASSDLLDFVLEHLEKDTKLTDLEKRIIGNFSYMIFDNEEFVKTKRMVSSGVRFVRKCKQQGHKVFLLSNWDDSIGIMKRLHPEFFSLFDGMIVSADVHLLKPDPKIYQLLLDKYQLDPRDSVLIDDEPINLKGAQEVGIHPIWCTRKRRFVFSKPDFKKVKHELRAWEKIKACSL